jgi:putative membrane protein
MHRKFLLVTAAVASLALVSACNKKPSGETDLNPGQSQPVNAAQDATSTAVGETSAATIGRTTEGFVNGAAVSDMYEVKAANLALQMSKSAEVKKFAQQMITDHTASTNKLKALLPTSGAGVTPPADLDERRKGLIDNLNAAGDKFDEVYIDQQVAAHGEASTLFHTYADNGDNAPLKAFAAEIVPKIDMHLEMVKGLDKAGADDTAKPAH